jgi:hypothetical protein
MIGLGFWVQHCLRPQAASLIEEERLRFGEKFQITNHNDQYSK